MTMDAMDTLTHIASTLLLAVGALLPIVDPLGSVPIYLAMTSGLAPEGRPALARMVAIDCFLLLLGSSFLGAYVLDFFDLSVPAVQVAGGILVCGIGWGLLNGPDAPQTTTVDRQQATSAGSDRTFRKKAFYPLTMPLTVGPGSISVAITLGANPHPTLRRLLVTGIAHTLGILLVCIAVYLCYRYAHVIVRAMSDTARSVLMRLSAFVLVAIGVQITWNGVHALLVGAFPHLAH